MTTFRRVVTGTRDGHADFVDVSVLDPIGDTPIYSAYGWDRFVRPPADGPSDHAFPGVFPRAGGVRVNFVEFPPANGTDVQDGTAGADGAMAHPRDDEWERAVSVNAAHRERRESGYTATDTVDLVFIVEGEITVQLDGDREETLRQGDLLVQNGTGHRWLNRSGARCITASVVFGLGSD